MPSQTIFKPWHFILAPVALVFPPLFLFIIGDMIGTLTPDMDDRWWDADEPLGGRW